MLFAGVLATAAMQAQVSRPSALIGTFHDDYGTAHTISADVWRHGKAARYDIAEWHADEQFFIAHNAADNPSDPGKWSRVDWVMLPDATGTPAYEWAYCMSAYDAPSAEAARAVTVAKRENPKTGCNGFPFTRMARSKESVK